MVSALEKMPEFFRGACDTFDSSESWLPVLCRWLLESQKAGSRSDINKPTAPIACCKCYGTSGQGHELTDMALTPISGGSLPLRPA